MKQNKEEHKGNEKKKNGIVIILLICVVAVLAAAVVYLLWAKAEEDAAKAAAERRGTISLITEDSDATVGQQVEDGYFRCVMTTEWYYTDGVPSNVYVANHESNTRDFYFEVYLKDTEEVLYSSLVVPTGYDIRNFELEKELDKGTYDALVTYFFLDEEQNVQEQTSFAIIITIK